MSNSETNSETNDEYHFDYDKAQPNRFATRLQAPDHSVPLTVADVLAVLDTVAPSALRLNDDPDGFHIGDPQMPVTGIVVALDATLPIVQAAHSRGANLIITHHPLLYYPLKSVRYDRAHPDAAAVYAIRQNMAVASAHTRWDIAPGGINDVLANCLGLVETRPLQITYREPGVDGTAFGMGRVGTLGEPGAVITVGEFARRIANALNFPAVRVVGNGDHVLQTVAVCGGAGGGLIGDAIRAGADALVTSDIRHHEFIDAQAQNLILIDAGHAATELPGTRALADRLRDTLTQQGQATPVHYLPLAGFTISPTEEPPAPIREILPPL